MIRRLFIVAAVLFLGSLALGASFPELFTKHAHDHTDAQALLQTPSELHVLGTDELGRDLLARLLYGARVSLACALLATLLSATFGVLYGSVSGFLGGRLDQALMRFLDLLYSIPDLLFYILLGLFLGRGFWGLLIALSSLSWVGIARLTRGEVRRHKNLNFAEAAVSLGASPGRVLVRHLLPQIKEPLLIALLLKIPAIILIESTLSFIGLGLTPPHASWGTLASEGVSALRFYPHLILYPSLFIFLTILSFQTLGRNLQKQK